MCFEYATPRMNLQNQILMIASIDMHLDFFQLTEQRKNYNESLVNNNTIQSSDKLSNGSNPDEPMTDIWS